MTLNRGFSARYVRALGASAFVFVACAPKGAVLYDDVIDIGRATISGDVLDSAGVPQRGLIVFARVLEQGPVTSRAQTTDSLGKFTFTVTRSSQTGRTIRFPDTVSATIFAQSVETGSRIVASVDARVVLDTVARVAPVLSVRLVRASR